MRLLHTISLVLLSASLLAQTFVARVNKTELSLGENFQLVFELQGDGSKFSPPPLADFMLLSGPNKASNMQWVNGSFSSSVSYSYMLRAVGIGAFEIGAASIQVDGKELKTDPIPITVGRAQARTAPANPSQNPRNPSRPDVQGGNEEQLSDEISANIFMKLFVNKKDVFVGEQLLASYKLYLNVNVLDYGFNNLVFNGFYAEDLKLDGNANVTTEVINGKQFQVHTLKQTLLTPQKSGSLEIPSLESEMVIRVRQERRARSLFDQVFGNYKNAKINISSNPEKVNVKALPRADQPGDFTGAVGNFTLKVNADHNEVSINEAINVTIEVAGNGNLELISPPTVEFPSDFESYDPKVKNNVTPSAAGSRGSKSYEYVIIPRFAGEYTLKPITFSYFDPAANAYKRLTADPLKLRIAQTEGENESGIAYVAPKKEDVQIIGKDIRYIHTDDPILKRSEERFCSSTLFYILMVLPFAGMGAALFGVSFYRAQQNDTTSLKSRRAKGLAKKHLAQARKLVTGEDAAFYEAISSALFGYISDKLAIPRSALNRERIEEELRARAVADVVQSDLKKALDECEMVRFAPGIVRGKQEMLNASANIIEALEDEL
ncbi:MAG: protein BatD [Flavobacteriales bacterium]|nr:protein BatD [Flavobacteriales bacterium]